MTNDLNTTAYTLISSGWTPYDKDDLIAEYELSEEEADAIIEEMIRVCRG